MVLTLRQEEANAKCCFFAPAVKHTKVEGAIEQLACACAFALLCVCLCAWLEDSSQIGIGITFLQISSTFVCDAVN